MLLDYGIEIIEGAPGSGKSYYAVRRALDVVMTQRRPVYTNLPFRWPAVRRWLRSRGGEELSRLLVPLGEASFRAFCERFAAARRAREEFRVRGLERAALERAVESALPAKVISASGPDELINWVPGGSVICIDEAQNWYPMEQQKRDPSALLAFLSMHRHGMYWVWAITQDGMRLDNKFRVLAAKRWYVRNMADEKFLWGVRWRHVGLTALGYSMWTGDQVRGRAPESGPLENYVTLHTMPWNRWVFRLYDSLTQAGRADVVESELEYARARAGVASKAAAVPVRRTGGAWDWWREVVCA